MKNMKIKMKIKMKINIKNKPASKAQAIEMISLKQFSLSFFFSCVPVMPTVNLNQIIVNKKLQA